MLTLLSPAHCSSRDAYPVFSDYRDNRLYGRSLILVEVHHPDSFPIAPFLLTLVHVSNPEYLWLTWKTDSSPIGKRSV